MYRMIQGTSLNCVEYKMQVLFTGCYKYHKKLVFFPIK